jgi:hypothetical protein
MFTGNHPVINLDDHKDESEDLTEPMTPCDTEMQVDKSDGDMQNTCGDSYVTPTVNDPEPHVTCGGDAEMKDSMEEDVFQSFSFSAPLNVETAEFIAAGQDDSEVEEEELHLQLDEEEVNAGVVQATDTADEDELMEDISKDNNEELIADDRISEQEHQRTKVKFSENLETIGEEQKELVDEEKHSNEPDLNEIDSNQIDDVDNKIEESHDESNEPDNEDDSKEVAQVSEDDSKEVAQVAEDESQMVDQVADDDAVASSNTDKVEQVEEVTSSHRVRETRRTRQSVSEERVVVVTKEEADSSEPPVPSTPKRSLGRPRGRPPRTPDRKISVCCHRNLFYLD